MLVMLLITCATTACRDDAYYLLNRNMFPSVVSCERMASLIRQDFPTAAVDCQFVSNRKGA